MKKVMITLLFITTIAYSSEESQTVQLLQKKIQKKADQINNLRSKSYLTGAFAFFAGNTIRLPRLVSIPGALLCGIGIFKPTFFSEMNKNFSMGENTVRLKNSLWKIANNSFNSLITKTEEFANKSEKKAPSNEEKRKDE